jgi:hypothetical protein
LVWCRVQNNKFTPEDFISFLRSISNQSRTLVRIFADSQADMPGKQQQHATASAAVSDKMHHREQPAASASMHMGAMKRGGVMRANACDLGLSDDNDAEEPAEDMTAKLIRRRRREARRRQLGCYPGTLAQKQGHFLTTVVRRLIAKLPPAAKAELLMSVRAYVDRVTTPEEFRDVLQGLVDEHGIIVELDYMPEHEAREVTAKEIEQARIRSNRTNAAQTQSRKRTAGGQQAPSTDNGKRTKVVEGVNSRNGSGGMPAMEALDVPAFADEQEAGMAGGGGGCPACDLGMFGDVAYGGRCPQCGSCSSARQKNAEAAARGGAHASPRHAGAGGGDGWRPGDGGGYGKPGSIRQARYASPRTGPNGAAAMHQAMPMGPVPKSSDLPDTELGTYLTHQAQRVAALEREVRVNVVSATENFTGGGCAQRYPYRCKCILAFQKLDGAEVIFFGMYVHEFGPQATAPAAGRVYIECLDSIPLHGDLPADRQLLLTTVVHSYLRYIRSQGFRQVHIRVPPPSAENSHIFAYRSLKIRLEATLRMAQWYKRLLDGALQSGVVASFEGESHLSKLESFPPCILPAADIAEEHAFSAMRSTAVRLRESGNQEGVDASVLQRLVSFKERFFVAHLVPPEGPAPRRLLADDTPLHMCPVVMRRRDLIAVCARDRLSFTSLESAKFATAFILRRLIAFARRSGAAPPAAAPSTAAHMAADERMPEWVHQQIPTFEEEEMQDTDAAPARGGARGRVPDDSDASARTTPPAQEQQEVMMVKMEDLAVPVMPMADNMLLDGAELVREVGVLEPLGDLDDAELFADSLFSA